jgi:ribosomal protein S17E
MKKIKNNEKLNPDFPEPTNEEIKKTKQTVADKYGVKLSDKDLIRFIELTKELQWWFGLKSDLDSTAQITNETIAKLSEICREKYNQEITNEDAFNSSKEIIDHLIEVEKQRIRNEIISIIKR